MSSTKRNPDEPGRGTVATGQHPVEPGEGDGTGSAEAASGARNGNGRGTESPVTQGDAGADVPASSEQATEGAPVTGSDIVAAEADGADTAPEKGAGSGKAAGTGKTVGTGTTTGKGTTAGTGTAAAAGEPAGPATSPDAGTTSSDVAPDAAATARFRLPSPSDTVRIPVPDSVRSAKKGSEAPTAVEAKQAPAEGSATQATDGAAPPTVSDVDASTTTTVLNTAGTTSRLTGSGAAAATPPSPPTLDPLPAPAVPAPGPGAAQPPPWRRLPGQDGRPESSSSAADRLLDDGPTAFLEAPRYAPSSSGASGGESPVSETGGWARATRSRPPRQAALQLKRLDPWSVLKLALVLAVVLFFIWLVAVGVLYGVLDGMGVWDRLNGTYADLVSGEAQTGNTLISAGRVFGLAAVVGAINSLLFAVAVTVGAFVYNVSADLVGGIEVTLSERD